MKERKEGASGICTAILLREQAKEPERRGRGRKGKRRAPAAAFGAVVIMRLTLHVAREKGRPQRFTRLQDGEAKRRQLVAGAERTWNRLEAQLTEHVVALALGHDNVGDERAEPHKHETDCGTGANTQGGG